MKKNRASFLTLFFSLLLVVFCSLKCTESKAELSESEVYPSNPIDFSQRMLLYIKSELPYQAYSDTLQQINLKKLHEELNSPEKKLAFWLNIYNALVQVRLIESPTLFEKKEAFFKHNDIVIGGSKLSLDDIENGVLRLKTTVSNSFFTQKFKLDSLENRIHFTLNCGATSCPAIAYYDPEKLDQQLEEATQFYIKTNCTYNPDQNQVMVSELFSWFKDDFNGEGGIIKFLKNYGLIPENDFPKIVYTKYDWGVKPANFNG